MTYQREITRRSVYLGHQLSRGTLRFSGLVEGRCAMSKTSEHGISCSMGCPLRPIGSSQILVGMRRSCFSAALKRSRGLISRLRSPVALDCVLSSQATYRASIVAWFDAAIAPHLDGEHVSYIGPVSDAEKNALLGLPEPS